MLKGSEKLDINCQFWGRFGGIRIWKTEMGHLVMRGESRCVQRPERFR